MTIDERTIYSEEPETATGSSPHSDPPARRHRKGLAALAGGLVVVVAVGLGAAGAVILRDGPAPVVIEQAAPATETIITTGSSTTGVDATAIGLAVIPSVVTVEIGQQQGDGFTQFGSGSGVVVDGGGLIVTNNHVVESAQDVRVVLSDARVYDAEIVGTDPLTDLAVLRIAATDLKPISFGSTAGLRVGDPAVAVGSPLGLQGGPSLTVGVVSALGREVQTDAQTILYGMLQTDAPITSGSSGGSLVDSQGRLIGITTAVGVSQVGVEGIGFATPIEIVERVVTDIIADGDVDHALIGITGTTAFADRADGGRQPIGVEVVEVTPNSGAAGAGIEVGDVITAFGGTRVDTMDELITVLRTYTAGDAASMDLADGTTVAVTLTTR